MVFYNGQNYFIAVKKSKWNRDCNIAWYWLWQDAAAAKSLQSFPTLCDPVDGSPPGSSIHGIFQARVLEWGVISFSEGRMLKLSNQGSLICKWKSVQ